MVGNFAVPVLGKNLAANIEKQLDHKILYIAGKAKKISTVAWCTGAAQDYMESAAASGVDAYLTGEISERAVYAAQESGIHLFVAGHYATERYGVQALGRHLADKFNLKHNFIEIYNPL